MLHARLALVPMKRNRLFLKMGQMKLLNFLLIVAFPNTSGHAQAAKTELYELMKSFIPDSTGYENVGDWNLGNPKRSPVTWSTDRVEMSNDTSINFYRRGTADVTIKGRTMSGAGKPVTWNIMLKGPRMGYTSFSILTTPSKELSPKYTLDSLFGKNRFIARLLKSCDTNPSFGYYYYSLKLPAKDPAFVKISWITANAHTALRIDSYDSWSNYAVKLACPGSR